jgi:hypothetical protein
MKYVVVACVAALMLLVSVALPLVMKRFDHPDYPEDDEEGNEP